MENTADRAIAIVGVGAILPGAPDATTFWENIKRGRYSISEVSSDRWDPALYYDPDPAAPDKSYSKIGGWVREYTWDPMAWRLPIPPRVEEAMDGSQKWGIACTREALADYGFPNRHLDLDRTAVILGNAMGGEKHYFTALRLYFPEYARELEASASYTALPEDIRHKITRELRDQFASHLPQVTEDTMPGELSNCIAGRIANIFNFHGPNYVTDAACASAMAALSSAVEGLVEHDFDVAISGGIDRNMGASTFIKFSKIGALSATGTRPYAEGADGFVMGEGAVIFVLKRLADAERNEDKIYAVLRGMGGSSDGKGKGITAPNPIGQKFAIERAWQNAGLSPATAGLIEGHGTSTRVGDVVEVESMSEVLKDFSLPVSSIALGSVKSNIGHLKGAAGAAGLLKTILALRDKVLPPSVHCDHPNPGIDFAHSPLYVNRELRPWESPKDGTRRAGLSAFGFGGTNFHAVLEEYIPHKLTGNGKRFVAAGELPSTLGKEAVMNSREASHTTMDNLKPPLRGALVIGAESVAELSERLRSVQAQCVQGHAPEIAAPLESDLRAAERVAIDYADANELADRAGKAIKALATDQAPSWKALRAQGIFRGRGPAQKVAFLYTGQGSQYVNMLRTLLDTQPVVAQTFAEADSVMTPLLGKPLTDFIFVDRSDAPSVARAENDLRQTEITQPAVLACDEALTRLLAEYGIRADMTMGHSLGEYGALVASGALPFHDALEAVSARGRGMAAVAMNDNGKMAAIFAPLAEIEKTIQAVDSNVVIANINSNTQAVIGGASKAVEKAIELFQQAGYDAVPLSVSHAFHTSIVAGASVPLRKELERLHLESPKIPIVANVTGEFYPMGQNVVPKMLDILTLQVASPVQFVKGLGTLYEAGVRVFVEVGPKKALHGFAEDVLSEHGDVTALFTNHPKSGDIVSFNQALCALYAAGLGKGRPADFTPMRVENSVTQTPIATVVPEAVEPQKPAGRDSYLELGHIFADAIERGMQVFRGKNMPPPNDEAVVITGAALGLPGTEHIFDDANIARILRGESFIDVIPMRFRQAMLDKHITRLVKSDNGGPTFDSINNLGEVIKLAARGNTFDLEKEFGVSAERMPALDRVTQLAIAVGIDALRDSGIPLVMRYKTTSKGTQLPDRWMLPDALRDDTGIIFASAFPGYESFSDEMSRYYADRARRDELAMLQRIRDRIVEHEGHSLALQELDRRIAEVQTSLEKEPYLFERRFLFKTLAMGHSQFAEFIGARGPNTQINSACATTAQAITLAEDWIRAGRCRRVVIISADDVTSDHMLEWIGAGFLATGAAATDETLEDAAIPFDRRRHGMLIGMGAAALVVESAAAAQERGIQPICEIFNTVTANSAFHGTRLDVDHIGQVMENLVAGAETRRGISRGEIAPNMVFVSHETYTPARGGSAAAEIHALRRVFGNASDRIVIANTKGFTGHAMATGIEDVVAVKALETGCVPPVANFKEVDPELGQLNLSKGGMYPVEYALHLAAGFGSQISMVLLHHVAISNKARPKPEALGYAHRIVDQNAWSSWLKRVAGYPVSELHVIQRTLRVPDNKVARINEVSVGGDKAHSMEPSAAKASIPSKPFAVPAAPASASPTTPAKPDSVTSPSVSSKFDPVKERVLELAVEKTGYPKDMLDLDLDLEADLGVDTVKQAEMFAAIREIYNIPREENRKLRDYPTLAHVIRFVYEKRPDLAGAPTLGDSGQDAKTAPPQTNALPPSDDPVRERVLALVVEKTGYPKDMLDLDLDLEADLGVDTVKQAELFSAIREIYNIPRDENLKLRDYPTLGHVIRFVYEKCPALSSAHSSNRVEGVAAQAPKEVQGAASANINDVIKEKVLAIVAEKTGYPTEMLDLDLDLEADLGIDTVKQAEMFASVRSAFNIPRDAELKLRDFPTLAHVIKFAIDRRPREVADSEGVANVSKKPPSAASTPVDIARPMVASFEAANTIPRRVPIPVLRPGLSLCKSTSVSLESGRRVIVMPDEGGVATSLIELLRKRDVEVLQMTAGADANAINEQVAAWLKDGVVHGVYWLTALDPEADLRDLDLAGWHNALWVRVKSLYTTMRALYEQIAPAGTFLVSATRLGGQHGYDQRGAMAPLGGAVAGFVKTYKRERVDALAKVVDFGTEHNSTELANILIQETLRDPGAVEVGYKDGLRWTVGLEEQPAGDGRPGLMLGKDSVFLITGAAGSIVSAITADLAAASGGTFYLLDLVPQPDANNPDLKRFVEDKDGLKRELFARIQARGERATPALIESELAALERANAAQAAIDAVCAAGGAAHYFSVDLRNSDAVEKVIRQVHDKEGRIDVLLHAAGIERSHFLPDKQPQEFDLIFDVKSDGWFNLLHAIGDMPLAATVAFSSIAGRFGNAGQADYSSANDLLCKLTSSFRSTRPGTRGIVIDWTAWGGIGMATRGSIPKMMEIAGIDMLPPEAGIPLVRRELVSGGTKGEVVVGQRLGALLSEWDSSGGVDTEVANPTEAAALGPMIGKIAACNVYSGLRIDTVLDPKVQPFLHDHQIDGTPVLPGVMGIEGFAEAAKFLLPDWHIAAIEDVNLLSPFKFYRNEPRTVTLQALTSPKGDCVVADCKLTGSRLLPNQTEPQETTHFTARVRITREVAPPASGVELRKPEGAVIKANDIYPLYFHGPAYRVLEKAWWNGTFMIGKMAKHLPSNHEPSKLPTILKPRLIELCFQTAGLWEMGVLGRMGLPQHIDELILYRMPDVEAGALYAIVTPDSSQASFDAEVTTASGQLLFRLHGYRTVELPSALDEKQLMHLKTVMALQAVAA